MFGARSGGQYYFIMDDSTHGLKVELFGKRCSFYFGVEGNGIVIRFDVRKVGNVVVWKLHYPFQICHTSINLLFDIVFIKLSIGPGKVIAYISLINEALLLNEGCGKINLLVVKRFASHFVMLAKDDVKVSNYETW